MCDDETPLRGRIAILSAEIHYTSDIVNRIIVFIEHAQSVSLFFITNYKAFGQSDNLSSTVNISTPVYYFSTLLGPGNVLVFDHDHINQIFSVLVLAFCFFIFRILLFLYIVYLAIRKKEGSKTVISIWRVIFKIQCRVLYYLMASLWANTASAALADKIGLGSSLNYFIVVVATVMLVLEYAFAIFLQTQFEGFLPSKSFLASKSNMTEMITLTQKFVDQILRRVLLSVPTASIWVNNIFLVILSAVRLKHYLYFLPPYRICSLRYQAFFLVVVFCLNIASLCQNIFENYPVNLDFVVFLWIVLSVLMVKLVMDCLNKRILKLALSNEIETPEALLHRLIIIKEIFKQRTLPDSLTAKIPMNHLLVTTLDSQMREIFDYDSESFDWSNKEKREELFTIYLESLLKRFPRNILLRLYTAYHYAKKRKMYGLCIKTLSNLKHLSSWRITVSIAILFENIKTVIQHDYHHGKEYLFNIDEYAQSTSFVAKLKLKMIAQSQLQIDLCNEITGTQPNLEKIMRSREKAVDIKKRIEKEINLMEEYLPDSYLEPLMICANYHLLLNHKYEKYTKYCEAYLKRREKYDKIFKDPQLRIEQFYQEDTGLLIVSGDSKRQGDIVYCGGNFNEILGTDMTGAHLSSVTPPSIRFASAQKIKTSIEQGAKNAVNHVQDQFFYNIKGFMTQVRYYFNFNAYTPQGLVYYFIYQPLREFKETILVNNEGYIESCTRGIGRKLGLLSGDDVYKNGEIHIGNISSELTRINLAFHMVNFPEKFVRNSQSSAVTSLNSKFLDFQKDSVLGASLSSEEQHTDNIEKAKEIVSLWTEKGDVLTLYKADNRDQKGSQYHCKVTSMVINGNLLKFIALDEVYCGDSSDSEMDCPDEKLPIRMNRSIEKSQRLNELIPDSSARKLNNTTRSQIKLPSSSERRENIQRRNFKENQIAQPKWLTSSKIQLSKVFSEALNKEHYPSSYKIFLAILFTLFMVIFAIEIVLHSEVNSCVPTLSTGKNILQIIQSKSRSLARLNAFAICLENYATGKLILSDYDSELTVDYFVNMARTEMIEIENSSTNLVDIVSTLQTDDALPFFEANVQMFQTYFGEPVQISSNMTIFQAVSQIAESTLQALTLFEIGTNTSYSEAIPYIQFMIRNTMNNILIRNELIDSSLQIILQEKQDKTLERFTWYSVVLLVSFVLVIVLCCYLGFLQYSNEKRSILSLLKLKKTSLKKMTNNIDTFQTLLKRNVNFLMALQQEPISYLSRQNLTSRKASSKSFQISELSIQNLSFRPLRLSYYCLVLKATSFIVISILFVIANILILKTSFDDLEGKAHQLHSLDKMNSQVVLTASILQELVVGDSSALVKDTPLDPLLVSETESLGNVIHEFTGILTSQNLDQVSIALFEDGCVYLKEDLKAFALCKQLALGQKNSGLINLLANYESILNSVYTKYKLLSGTIDRDTQVSLQLEVLFDVVSPCFRVLRLLNFYVFNLLDDDLDRFADGIIKKNNGITAGLLVSLFLGWGVLHFMGMVRLRNKENQFKELIQLFPADVILSNFILKSYIMRISKEKFDFIRGDVV